MTSPADLAVDPVARYLEGAAALLRDVADSQRAAIDAAALLLARTLAASGLVHVFGSGHSHLLAAEMFYRAGGLAAVDPVFLDGLLLHREAVRSTQLERTAGIGTRAWAELGAGPHDLLVVVSNSGGNVVGVELAQAARAAGNAVVGLVSLRHARSTGTLDRDHATLVDVADVVLDNLGAPGDAATEVPGLAETMGPTSTVVGAAIVHAVAIGAATHLAAAGTPPEVFSSSNLRGGDEHNAALIERYTPRVAAL